jgi:glucose-like phosphotransferase system IIB component
VRPSATALQVVVGATADQLAGEIRAALPEGARAPAAMASPQPTQSLPAQQLPDAAALLAALGGRGNLIAVETAASRLRLSVRDAARVDAPRIRDLGLRGVAVPQPGCVHVIVGPGAAAAGAQLKRLLG